MPTTEKRNKRWQVTGISSRTAGGREQIVLAVERRMEQKSANTNPLATCTTAANTGTREEDTHHLRVSRFFSFILPRLPTSLIPSTSPSELPTQNTSLVSMPVPTCPSVDIWLTAPSVLKTVRKRCENLEISTLHIKDSMHSMALEMRRSGDDKNKSTPTTLKHTRTHTYV